MNENKVMLITGTRTGIGRYLAEYYSKKGFNVIGCSRGKFDAELKNYEHFCLDVSDEEKVKKMFSEIRKKYGRLDVLINNAGIASMNHSIFTTMETANKIMNTNFLGTFLFCREGAKLMMKNHIGRIVNFVTFASLLKLEGEAIYASSKAAVVNLTQILAREYADFGITINALSPALVETDLINSVPADKIKSLMERHAIKRFCEFKDISNAIDFFIHPNSDFITGQTLYLGGF